MLAFQILLLAMFAWSVFPAAILLAFATAYGYRAPAETTVHFGFGARLGVHFDPHRFYWCPIGLIGVEVEML